MVSLVEGKWIRQIAQCSRVPRVPLTQPGSDSSLNIEWAPPFPWLPDVRHIGRNVELGPWVKVVLRPGYWRTEALVLQPVKVQDRLEKGFGENQAREGWDF